jgi:hypothetical protein
MTRSDNLASNGYMKDAIAVVAFLIAFVVIVGRPLSWWCSPRQRNLIIFVLVACGTIDLLFTLNPEWHNRAFTGTDAPSACICIQAASMIAGIVYAILS